MKKVGILTLNGYFNYGNRLQNYATQEVLKSLGFFVETIVVNTESRNKNIVDRLCNISKLSVGQIYQRIKYKLWRYINKVDYYESKRTEVFKDFTRKYISETDYSISEGNIPKDLIDKYDYFVTGSDQVWNPDYINGSSIYFLTFAPKHKRIAFAPSFGISKIPDEYVEKYKVWLSQMDKLSVREEAGARIIKDLTGRDALVLVDPTMMLTREKWLSIAKEAPNKPKGKYLLTYFLGGVPSKYKGQIEDIAERDNLEIINLADIRDKKTYITGPSEFIDYINSCSILCTDSFHGTVFSILMEKPFIVFERMGTSSSMFSRINTLLDKFNLNSRKAW